MTTVRENHRTPALTKRWVRLLLSLTVSAAVGLAPYLGKARVPLFVPLLALFPKSIADTGIIFSTAAMSLVAVYVEFYGSDKTSLVDIEQKFRVKLRYCIGFLALLLIMYFVSVTPVPYNGGADTVTFVTGFTGSKDPRCAQKSSAQCILDVTHFDEANIDAAFGEQQIRIAKALLVTTYLGFMTTLAYLAGLIILGGATSAVAQRNSREAKLAGSA